MNFTPAETGRMLARWLVVLSLLLGIGGSVPGIQPGSTIAGFRKTEVSYRTGCLQAYRVHFTASSAVGSEDSSYQKQLRLHLQDALLKYRVSQQHAVSSRHKLGLSHLRITPESSDDSPLLIG